jgi:hypothetical protein
LPLLTSDDHGSPTIANVNVDDPADLEDRAALAAHYADRLAGCEGVRLAELDVALAQIDAEDDSSSSRLP